MRSRLELAVLALALVAGCSTGPRKPLFGGPDDTPRAPEPIPVPPPRGDLAGTPEAALLARLRGAKTEVGRRALADELGARRPGVGVVWSWVTTSL